MKFPYRSSRAGQTGQSTGKLTQLGAVAGLMPIIVPASLLVLQLSPDLCRACVTNLRICGE
ncbi:MAG TPA: hypothetical protein VF749_01350 [Candidatus Acidoferrum sp.]